MMGFDEIFLRESEVADCNWLFSSRRSKKCEVPS